MSCLLSKHVDSLSHIMSHKMSSLTEKSTVVDIVLTAGVCAFIVVTTP
jgi:hypothetical protein